MTFTESNTGMKIEIVTMTPEWALDILTSKNTKNRSLRSSAVQKYAYAIRTGQWELTPQGIAIGQDGVLLDGQHRLAAIVEAGQPVPVLMATDCDPSMFSVLDTGLARRASDVLHMKGAGDATSLAAGIKAYILMHQSPGNMWTGNGLPTPSHSEIGGLYGQRTEDANFAATVASSVYCACRQTNKSALVAFVLLCLDAGHERARIEEFCSSLGAGENLLGNSPILRLRSMLTNGILVRRSPRIQIHLACLIKAFNYWNEGVMLKMFKTPSIPPMPTVLP